MHSRRVAVSLAFVLSLSSVAPALAQVSADEPAAAGDPAKIARDRYNAGLQAYQARRFREAALHFEAASAAAPNAVALFIAGQAWELSDQPERAADAFVRCLVLPGLPPDKQQIAKDRVTALQQVLGRVEITAPEGWRVQLDSNTEVGVPATLHGSAGNHMVSVRAPNKPIDHKPVTLVVGQATKLDLTPAPEPKKEPDKPPPPPPPPPKPSPPPEEPSGSKLRRSLGFAAIGFGGAGIVSGIVLGLQANDAKDAYVARPSQAAYDHASAMQTWTNVAFIGGAVFLAGGVALVLWPAPKHAAPQEPPPEKKEEGEAPTTSIVIAPTLGGAVVRGSF